MTHEEETERFAARLRMLKERAGTSFEALAKQSGISRSSLHRYCSGTKLPVSYGAVHAFAKACGATGEELRELHRLWALAGATRSSQTSPERPAVLQDAEPEETGESRAPQPVAPASPPRLRLRTAWALLAAAFLVAAVAIIAVILRADQKSNLPAIAKREPEASSTAAIRVFNIEGDCKSQKERLPACSMGLARDPRLKYDADNVVSHRVWHNDVLLVDCVLYDGERVEDETGVGTTRWFRVRLDSAPGGHAWLPAVRSHDNPVVPVCA
ncbi:helix-turn-helix domain-containing protein [Microbispora sp. NPDC049125]|uniref:helix-turn-helix domain-containing protein n=1 Tax=Microbispora sp. NPDC049125 TaxID=3154929 RepID=UPI0034653CE4